MKMEPPFGAGFMAQEHGVSVSFQSAWPLAAAVTAAALAWLALWYWGTARTLVSTWHASETYAHGFLIVPISGWLIWRERFRLARLRPYPELRALPLFVLPGMAWLLGELSGVRVVQQFALVFTIVLMVWTMLGSGVARTLAFPLLFLLFAVPFGDFLLPLLMEYTARFTVFALGATGVPVHRDGMSIAVPSGDWSVVEACSGLRYLIACLTGGVLYAYLRYRSPLRRVLFVAAAAVVPVLANGVRAYLIVMLAELSDGRIAAGVDHLLYGWIFFGAVTLLLFAVGTIWREDGESTPAPLSSGARPLVRRPAAKSYVSAAIATGIAVAIWPAVALQLGEVAAAKPVMLSAPVPAGWASVERRMTDWRPQLSAPAALLDKTYESAGRRAGLHIAYHADQRHGPELVSSLNRLASADGSWHVVSENARTITAGGEPLSVIETRMQSGTRRLLVWRWYWVDGVRTTNVYWAKVLQIRSLLQGRGDAGALVMLYTDADAGSAEPARVLGDFAAAALPAITRGLERAQ